MLACGPLRWPVGPLQLSFAPPAGSNPWLRHCQLLVIHRFSHTHVRTCRRWARCLLCNIDKEPRIYADFEISTSLAFAANTAHVPCFRMCNMLTCKKSDVSCRSSSCSCTARCRCSASRWMPLILKSNMNRSATVLVSSSKLHGNAKKPVSFSADQHGTAVSWQQGT